MDINYLLVALLFIFLILFALTITKMQEDLMRMRATLERIAEKLGATDDDDLIDEQTKAELLALIGEGKKVQAIKQFRRHTGLGLKESKDYIDGLERHE